MKQEKNFVSIGKYFLRKDGAVVGPSVTNKETFKNAFPFRIGHLIYARSGHCRNGDQYSLVCEVEIVVRNIERESLVLQHENDFYVVDQKLAKISKVNNTIQKDEKTGRLLSSCLPSLWPPLPSDHLRRRLFGMYHGLKVVFSDGIFYRVTERHVLNDETQLGLRLTTSMRNDEKRVAIGIEDDMQRRDYFVSIGCAVPFCGYSVTELVDLGYIVIVQ